MTDNISYKDVRYCYGDVCAVHEATFEFPKNAITALIGPNGGGKSTLVKLLVGLLKPGHGHIEKFEGATIGYVPQITTFDSSFPATIFDLVLMGTKDNKITPFKRYSKQDKEKACEAIKRLSLNGLEDRSINQLSLGQLKRGLIARAIASGSNILVLDEPDESLDIEASKNLYEILKTLKEDTTIIIVSHHVTEILDVADYALYVMEHVKFYNEPKELQGILLKDGIFTL